MEQSESRLQQECFMWHWNSYPQYRGLFFKIKNEGTNKITGARDKATGLVAGVADSCIALPAASGVIFIEFKTVTGKQSESQKKWEKAITNEGYKYFIIRTLCQFKLLIKFLYDE